MSKTYKILDKIFDVVIMGATVTVIVLAGNRITEINDGKHMLKKLNQAIAKQNDIDGFDLKIIKSNESSYIISFVGEKRENKKVEFGAYNYLILRTEDNNEKYEEILELMDYNKILTEKNFYNDLMQELILLVNSQTSSSWIKYSNEQMDELDKYYQNIFSQKDNAEENEVSFLI